jgi:putative component of membrane protein insertase Oxa1/YidC/SpoIIIJ protein YidD
MRILNRLAILAIWVYQRTLSRYAHRRGLRCLHHPSCSHYGILAYKKYNFFKACVITFRRYQDCHPFSDRPYIDYP